MTIFLKSYIELEKKYLDNKLSGDPRDNARSFQREYRDLTDKFFEQLVRTPEMFQEFLVFSRRFVSTFKRLLYAKQTFNREPTWEDDYLIMKDVYGITQEQWEDDEWNYEDFT